MVMPLPRFFQNRTQIILYVET